MTEARLVDRWFPVARGEEVLARNVVQTQILGQEIAVWRDDDGQINAWENRCPHRGVRLSIGLNLGHELKCQYHGWRFASGTAQCTLIPAHPSQTPPRAYRASRYAVAEAYGFVWVRLGAADGVPVVLALDGSLALSLRSVFVDAPAPLVTEGLMESYEVTPLDSFIFQAIDGAEATLLIFIQPMSREQSLIHAVLRADVAPGDRMATLRHHNARLCAMRDAVETAGKRPR